MIWWNAARSHIINNHTRHVNVMQRDLATAIYLHFSQLICYKIVIFGYIIPDFWNSIVCSGISDHSKVAWCSFFFDPGMPGSGEGQLLFPVGFSDKALHELCSHWPQTSWYCLAPVVKQKVSSSDPLVLLSPRVEAAVCSSRAGKLEGKQHGRQVRRSKTPSDGRPRLQTSNLFPFMFLISRWWRNGSYYGFIN